MKALTHNRFFAVLVMLTLGALISCELVENEDGEANGGNGDFIVTLSAFDGSPFGPEDREFIIEFPEPVEDLKVSMNTTGEGTVQWGTLEKISDTKYSIKMIYAEKPTTVEITLSFIQSGYSTPSEMKTDFRISEAIAGPVFSHFSPPSGEILNLEYNNKWVTVSLKGKAEKIYLSGILCAQNSGSGSVKFNRFGFASEGDVKVRATWTSAYGEREATVTYRAVGVDNVPIRFEGRDQFQRENIDNYRASVSGSDGNVYIYQLSGRIDLLRVGKGLLPALPLSEPPDEATSIVTTFIDGNKIAGPEQIKLFDDATLISLRRIPNRAGMNIRVEYELRDHAGNITKATGSFDTF